MKLNLLFVDDEKEVLDSFRTMLIPFRDQFDAYFALSATAGFKILEEQKIDIVISDMVMPEIDGLQFLLAVRAKFPGIIRMVLTGYTDYEKAILSMNVAHQFITKPCKVEDLINKIRKLERIQSILTNPKVIEFISKLDQLPVMSSIYKKIEEELNKDDPSITVVSDLLSKDIFLSTKVLQMINSAFFNFSVDITDIKQAVGLLGLNIIRFMIIVSNLFDPDSLNEDEKEFIKFVWDHSLKVAIISSGIMRSVNDNKKLIDETYLAGLLHDVGKLVMMKNPDYINIMKHLMNKQDEYHIKELEKFGVTHVEIGTYLLTIWGLSEFLIDSVSRLHSEINIDPDDITPISALFLANKYIKNNHCDLLELKRIKYNKEFIESVLSK
jgi:HD-like signal output (HDOD) protein